MRKSVGAPVHAERVGVPDFFLRFPLPDFFLRFPLPDFRYNDHAGRATRSGGAGHTCVDRLRVSVLPERTRPVRALI